MVSIIILTHNAPVYVNLVLSSLQMTENKDYEIIVVDNASDMETKCILWEKYRDGLIDKLLFLDNNTFFARGNNIGASLASSKSEYLLLLNSDVEIKSPLWLDKLLDLYTSGNCRAVSFGYGMTGGGYNIADGYCFLVDKKLFDKYKISEAYEWWYGLALLETQILRKGFSIKAVNNFEKYIIHYGGKSGDAWKQAKGMDVSTDLYDRWLKKCRKQVECIYDLDKEVGSEYSSINVLRGIFPDNWCGELVDFDIKTEINGFLILKGYYPREFQGDETIYIYLNRCKKMEYHIKENVFTVKIPIKEKNQIVRISLRCNFAFKAKEPDIRLLTFVLTDVKTVY